MGCLHSRCPACQRIPAGRRKRERAESAEHRRYVEQRGTLPMAIISHSRAWAMARWLPKLGCRHITKRSTVLTSCRGRAARPDRRVLRRPHPVCIRQSQGPQHIAAQERPDSMGKLSAAAARDTMLIHTQCGAGVPERTKGYFGSHLTVVSKLLHVRTPTAPLRTS